LVTGVCAGLVSAGGCSWFSKRRGGSGARGVTDPGETTLTVRDLEDGNVPLTGPRGNVEAGQPVSDTAFANVQFAYDSFQIADTEVAKIEQVASYMRQNSGVQAVFEGHADERGSREYNLSLGEHRALSVRAYLVGLGIDGARVQTKSYGEEKPLDPGHDEKAWWQNRRVEFKLFR
jgi:peptidoglycan-associated lipoprotein